MRKILFFLCAIIGFLSAAVNINTATIDELKSLKGIGEIKARAIVAFRQDQNFTSIEDLKKIKGIGDKIYDQIKDQITVE